MVQEVNAIPLDGGRRPILLEQILSEAVRDAPLLRRWLLRGEFVGVEDRDRVVAVGRRGARRSIVNSRVYLLLRLHLQGRR